MPAGQRRTTVRRRGSEVVATAAGPTTTAAAQTAARTAREATGGAIDMSVAKKRGESDDDYTARMTARNRRLRERPKASPRARAQRGALKAKLPPMGEKMKAYHSKWLTHDKKQNPDATDADRSSRFHALRVANAAKGKKG